MNFKVGDMFGITYDVIHRTEREYINLILGIDEDGFMILELVNPYAQRAPDKTYIYLDDVLDDSNLIRKF